MDANNVLQAIESTMNESELKKEIQIAKDTFGKSYQALSEEEVKELKTRGNFAEDWSKVFKNGDLNVNRIWNNYFYGTVVLSGQSSTLTFEGIERQCGIYNSNLANVVVCSDVLIFNVKMLQNYLVKSNAILSNVDEITNSAGSTFGNGVEIPVAIETGGREVYIYSDMTIQMGEVLSKNRANAELLKSYDEKLKNYIAAITSDYGVIKEKAVIQNTTYVGNTYVGESAVIKNATKVSNVTIYSNADEQTEILDGAYVIDSIIQWGCEAASMAIVDSSLMTEHSHVERHGKVTQSLLGPNTGIAEGEVTASLVGPFVGFHHQSLLIAVLWPEGKGNVGYGANVGSNHTAKAPDQEIWPGEGTFFGLGVNIKFPADYTKAPYSIIATGVNALPQKVEMPFSLINESATEYEGISPAFNEIFPAWVLSDNIYTIKRNEGKYAKRNKAKRSELVFEVFRPDIIDLMVEARSRLQNIKEKKELYLERDIKGLGKNYLLERTRLKAIDTYTFYLKYYALNGVFTQVKANGSVDLNATSTDARWEHERTIFQSELAGTDVKAALSLLKEMQQKIAEDVHTAKSKDDKRGVRVIPDYAEAHSPASEDGFVKETYKVTEESIKEIDSLIAKL